MPWVYKDIPESILLPACRFCGNRSRVSMILRGVFTCGDCGGRPFVAVWRDVAAVPSREERVG